MWVYAVSIHTPLAGCDHTLDPSRWRHSVSIHTPLAGCDGKEDILPPDALVSIHTPLAGCDKDLKKMALEALSFNPHTPRGM